MEPSRNIPLGEVNQITWLVGFFDSLLQNKCCNVSVRHKLFDVKVYLIIGLKNDLIIIE